MDIHGLLKGKFGMAQFRPGQEQVIWDVISGKDTIAILPTGSGKSLCYQLPAAVLEGAILIVSPLVALMEDQVAIMKRNGEKNVVALNSFLSFQEKKRILERLESYKFIFISPEMLLQQHVTAKLGRLRLALIVVDEAHCISQWGFDFRPDYLRLGEFFSSGKRPNILALTATADEPVTADITHYLHLDEPIIHRQSLDRPNISFSIVKLASGSEKEAWLKERLSMTKGPGIVYVASRKRADELAAMLQREGTSIESYHAGKEQVDRAFIQEQFINGEIEWICATNAFGMGIHKNDIRQVIHEHIPQAAAGYVQEVGRAGRDGEQSAATLLYVPEDEGRIRFIIQEDLPQEVEIRQYDGLLKSGVMADESATRAGLSETGKRVVDYYLERMPMERVILQLESLVQEKEVQLQQMLRLIHSETCIRAVLLSFFGEACKMKPKYCCSNCSSPNTDWLLREKRTQSEKMIMDWEERLALLLL